MANFAATAAHLAVNNHKLTPAAPKHEQRVPKNSRAAAAMIRPRTSSSQLLVSNETRSTPPSASSKAALLAHTSRINAQHRSSPENIPPRTSSVQQKALLAATKSFEHQKPSQNKSLIAPLSAKQAMLTQKKIEARQLESAERRNSPIIKIAPEMLTDRPPIRMEREEKQNRERLHASAVTLAKQTYARQQANPHHSLQNTAQKLADEKLAKIQPSQQESLRDYYGIPPVRRSKSQHLIRSTKSHLGMDTTSDDLAQSQRIRSQMYLLQAQIAQVDASQRDQDRQKLIEAAKKKVHNDMHKLDETVFKETGKMSPAMMEEWDAKARDRLREKKTAESKPDDAVDVGGGRLLHRADIDQLAESRVKPTLAGIDQAVAKRHAEDEALRLQQEEKKREAHAEKERKRNEKAERKRLHDEVKAERKRQHEEEKAERRRVHEEKSNEQKHTPESPPNREREQLAQNEIVQSDQPAIPRIHQSTYDAPEGHRHSGVWSRLANKSQNRHSVHVENPTKTQETNRQYTHQTNGLHPSTPKRQSLWKRMSTARSASPDPIDHDESSASSSRFKNFTKLGRKRVEQSPTDNDTELRNQRHSIISTTSSSSKPPRASTASHSDKSSRESRFGGLRGAITKFTRRPNKTSTAEEKSSADKGFEPPSRPTISAPIAGSLEINRTTPPVSTLSLDQAGTGVVKSVDDEPREQGKRPDKLTGVHKDSKFHEEII